MHKASGDCKLHQRLKGLLPVEIKFTEKVIGIVPAETPPFFEIRCNRQEAFKYAFTSRPDVASAR